LAFAASDSAVESFDCETDPSSPGLSTRTETFRFVGWTCVDVASEEAAWLLCAVWPAACVPAAAGAACDAACSVAFAFAAAAAALDVLLCVTAPSSPGLSTRTDAFLFVGCTWVDVATGVRRLLARCRLADGLRARSDVRHRRARTQQGEQHGSRGPREKTTSHVVAPSSIARGAGARPGALL
jgi:hypothetical protein